MNTLLALCLRVAGAALRLAARAVDPHRSARAAREARRQAWRQVTHDPDGLLNPWRKYIERDE